MNHFFNYKKIILLTSCFFHTASLCNKRCITGSTKAKVLPLPVTASTATSLWFTKCGIQAAWKYNIVVAISKIKFSG